MRTEARIFLLMSGFFLVSAIVYGWWTRSASTTHHVEVAGTTGLVLTFGLSMILGTYFEFVARRIEPRPEDRADADIAEGAGELGFFSPGSYWPLGIGLSAMLAGLALAFFQIWLLIVAVILILTTAGGLLFEYYTKGHTGATT